MCRYTLVVTCINCCVTTPPFCYRGQSLCPAAPISGQLAALQRRDKAAAAAAGQKLPPVSRSSSQTDRGSQHNNSSSFKQEQQVAGGTAPNCSSSNNSSNSNSRQQSAGAASSSSGGDGGSLEVSGQGCEVRLGWFVFSSHTCRLVLVLVAVAAVFLEVNSSALTLLCHAVCHC